MDDISNPRIRSLLRQADRVANDGKRAAAEKLYRQIVEESPETTQAWIGLAQVARNPEDRESAYRQVLAIEPENDLALIGLGEKEESAAESQNDDVFEPAEEPLEPGEQKQSGIDLETVEKEEPSYSEQKWTVTPITEATELSEKEHSHVIEKVSEKTILYCANHPNRETQLRCNKCGKPICSSCAQHTPVGYRCPECIREQEDNFYSAGAVDYLLALIVTIPLSLLAGIIATRIGFFVIFLAAIAGSFIGRLAFRAAGRRRGRGMPQMVAAVVALGGILPALPLILGLLFGQVQGVLGLVWMGIYVVTATGAAYYQMR